MKRFIEIFGETPLGEKLSFGLYASEREYELKRNQLLREKRIVKYEKKVLWLDWKK